MKGKEFFYSMLTSFFIIVTLINVAVFILGSMFLPNAEFGYEAFLYPLIYGVFSLIPYVILYSKKELTLKQMIIRKVLQLICIEAILVSIVFGMEAFNKEFTAMVLMFCLSIFVIFVLVHLVTFVLDSQTAKKLTEDLHKFQNIADNKN